MQRTKTRSNLAQARSLVLLAVLLQACTLEVRGGEVADDMDAEQLDTGVELLKRPDRLERDAGRLLELLDAQVDDAAALDAEVVHQVDAAAPDAARDAAAPKLDACVPFYDCP